MFNLQKLPPTVLSLKSWTPVQKKKPFLIGWQDKRLSLQEAMETPLADAVGLQFPIENKIIGIDLDHVVVDGVLEPWAMGIVETLNSYTEYSMSSTGLHILVGGVKPDGYRKKKGQVECFAHAGLQLVLTGNILPGYETLRDNQDGLVQILEEYLPYVDPHQFAPAPQPNRSNEEDAIKRARAYIAKMPDSISGQDGHTTMFNVAQVVLRGFALPPEQAWDLLCEYNQSKCQPPWSQKELRHKMDEVLKTGLMVMGCKLEESRQLSASQEYIKEAVKDIEEEDTDTISVDDCVEAFHVGLETGSFDRVSTGIYELDFALRGGIRPGELVIIQGRPSHGKTAIALHIQEAFMYRGFNVLMISKEMSKEAMGQRIMQRLTGDETTKDKVDMSRKVWTTMRPPYTDKARMAFSVTNIDDLMKIVSQAQQRYGSQVVIVDYLQLLARIGGGGNQTERMTEVSLKLTGLKQFGLTLVVLSQMNREIERRDGFSPKMSDARDTGQIEQDCDISITVVWDKMVLDKNGSRQFPESADDDFTIYVHKNRHSGIAKGVVQCKFDPHSQQFNSPHTPDHEEWSP